MYDYENLMYIENNNMLLNNGIFYDLIGLIFDYYIYWI